jgi:uncharacterized membrane protein YraQ (UPF0718 family)
LRPFSAVSVYVNRIQNQGDKKMDALINLLAYAFDKLIHSFLSNWPFLLISIVVAALLKLYFDANKVSAFLTRHRRSGIIGATALAVGTPLCSCGTMAVILGMMASMMPWAPIVAFMAASPLSSPEELIYSAGLFGWPFAIIFFITSILVGLLGGLAAAFFEAKGWLANQARFVSSPAKTSGNLSQVDHQPGQSTACACEAQPVTGIFARQPVLCGCETVPSLAVAAPQPLTGIFAKQPTSCACNTAPQPCACSPSQPDEQKLGVTAQMILDEIWKSGPRLLLMFSGFAFIGYLLNGLIPTAWVSTIFGNGNLYSIPLAATLGLPLYINSEASLPLVRALIDGGMSQGAALAFLVTGSGTSFGALAGALTIARWRVIGLVVATLWISAVIVGYAYNFLMAAGIF